MVPKGIMSDYHPDIHSTRISMDVKFGSTPMWTGGESNSELSGGNLTMMPFTTGP